MRLLLAAGLLIAAGPALAAQEPKPVDKAEPHVCTVAYREDRATHVPALIGDQVTLQFGTGETIEGGGAAAFSDTVSIVRVNSANLVMLKAKAAMPLQPIVIRMVRPDGSAHVYLIEWETSERHCLLIRWTYAAEEAAARRATWALSANARRSRDAEVALAAPPPVAQLNTRYTITGDPRLLQQVTKP